MKSENLKIVEKGVDDYYRTDDRTYIDNTVFVKSLVALVDIKCRFLLSKAKIGLKDDILQETLEGFYIAMKNKREIFFINSYLSQIVTFKIYSHLSEFNLFDYFTYIQDDDEYIEREALCVKFDNNYEVKIIYITRTIEQIRQYTLKKLEDHLYTKDKANLLLLPLMCCIFDNNYSLIEKYPYRLKLVARKIAYEIKENFKYIL